jgi:hypothetical protein
MEAFAAMRRNMAKGGGTTWPWCCSPHGAMIDGNFYLLPYGVDARTPARSKPQPSCERVPERGQTAAEHGRVLVLLDACRSGAVTRTGQN